MDKIIDILKQDTNYYTFVQMLKLTGVFEELSGKGPFTIFVPDNEAFSKIPSGRLTEIMSDTEFMRDVIHYHIVPGEHDSKILSLENKLTTLLGPDLDIKYNEDLVINKAKVIIADIFTSNGIIHVIDRVIKPPEILAAT
ncbi:MAG: fasciclin domain-containing protein [Candidatus Lokiarchaeota archaeon]|nr:fasciclin domain-containing protein [Candidatus Lokiarchaeota archaeon]